MVVDCSSGYSRPEPGRGGSRTASGAFNILGCRGVAARFGADGERVGLVAKLIWQVKLVAELRPGVLTETEVARIERDKQAGLADLRLRLAETVNRGASGRDRSGRSGRGGRAASLLLLFLRPPAGDCIVRWGCLFMAVAARCAAGGHSRDRLVARGGSF
jgi:hypothetical protein